VTNHELFARIFLSTQLLKSHHQNKLKFVWAGGPELKPFAQKKLKSCTNFAKCRHKGLSSITGKALHVLLSMVSPYFIRIAFLFLGYFCQSVHPGIIPSMSQSVASTNQEFYSTPILKDTSGM
jgi:hypothetical protein